MALVLDLNIIAVVLCGAMIGTFGFLVVSIVVAFFDPPKGYGWLRCSICAAGVIFSSAMSLFLYVATSFWRGGQLLMGSELSELRIGMAILSIPMVVGLLAAVGTKHQLVRRTGNLVVYGISPVVLVLVIADGPGGTIRDLTPWILTATVAEMIAWGVLVIAGRGGPSPERRPVRLNKA
ncbi:hypothetical protein [Luteolibacter soli]|uniref:DUF998 domain-containing protein n=1 Tax=Luteolibacter soli TaxID=3135280 RepID=A0ABU9B0Q2_9BACT